MKRRTTGNSPRRKLEDRKLAPDESSGTVDPVIASVAFRNFKALRNTKLVLAPFNLLVGPNGSGKTSLIEAISLLRTLAYMPAGEPTATSRPDGPEINFRFLPPYEELEATLCCQNELVCDTLEIGGAHPELWLEARADLFRVRSYLFDHRAMSGPALLAEGRELSTNGGNLAAVLALRRKWAPPAFARIVAEFTRLLPEFRSLEIVSNADGARAEVAAVLAGGGGTVPVGNLSQGTLLTLALLTLTLDGTPPTIVCIEEVDRGLHPRMLKEMRDLLYHLSNPASFGATHSPTQVIATTHSPYLLDLFRDHPEEVVVAQKSGDEARFERLADRSDLPELLKEGSLGEMWFAGILGGVPEPKSS